MQQPVHPFTVSSIFFAARTCSTKIAVGLLPSWLQSGRDNGHLSRESRWNSLIAHKVPFRCGSSQSQLDWQLVPPPGLQSFTMFRSAPRSRLSVTGVTPRKEAIKCWPKRFSWRGNSLRNHARRSAPPSAERHHSRSALLANSCCKMPFAHSRIGTEANISSVKARLSICATNASAITSIDTSEVPFLVLATFGVPTQGPA